MSGPWEGGLGELPLEAAQLHAVVDRVVDGLAREVGVVATPALVQALPEHQVVVVAGRRSSSRDALVHIKYYVWLVGGQVAGGRHRGDESAEGLAQSSGLPEVGSAPLLVDGAHHLVGHAGQLLVLLVETPLQLLPLDAQAGVVLAQQVPDRPDQPHLLQHAAALSLLPLHLHHAPLQLHRQVQRRQFGAGRVGAGGSAVRLVVELRQQVSVSFGERLVRGVLWGFSMGMFAFEGGKRQAALHSGKWKQNKRTINLLCLLDPTPAQQPPHFRPLLDCEGAQQGDDDADQLNNNRTMMSNREAYEQPQISIKVKNKFINLLFENRQLEQVTYHKTIGCFVVVCLLFLTLSIYFFVDVSKVVEVRQKYYSTTANTCLMGMSCDVRFTTPEHMNSPIYFMYELGNFYQNHRRYIQSKNNYQLAGNSISSPQAQSCFPYITNADMRNALSWKGNPLNPNDIASPCGSIAYTFFNDTFALYNSAGVQIPINEQGISWEGDKGQKFKRSEITETEQWMDPENEHFIVWMRTSGLPNFKKPWGKIERDLPAGEYRVTVKNNYNSTEWNGNRYFLLTTLSLVGGRNFVLPITFMVIALLSLVSVLFFCRRFRSLRKIARIQL